MKILRSTDAYEAFLRNELGEEVVEEGLLEKRDEMASGPFPFLRATYWRWAETIQDIAPELIAATRVLAVGDIHLENFGTWRDLDGRLVWGVNDYDEAAEMPYTMDLLRLATSALLTTAEPSGPDAQAIADAILSGYRKGLSEPRPFILDRDLRWLREAVIVPENERAGFWTKLDKKRRKFEQRPEEKRPRLWPRYKGALLAALPSGASPPQIWYRSAGVGSLGRPRWVAQSMWCGDWVIREAKGVVPSGWTRVHDGAARALRCIETSTGRYRSPDPWYRLVDGIVLRRLSPNNRKINAYRSGANSVNQAGSDDEDAGEKLVGIDVLLSACMLGAMGQDLAAIHVGTGGVGGAVCTDLMHRKDGWLADAAQRTATALRSEHAEFRKDWPRRQKKRKQPVGQAASRE